MKLFRLQNEIKNDSLIYNFHVKQFNQIITPKVIQQPNGASFYRMPLFVWNYVCHLELVTVQQGFMCCSYFRPMIPLIFRQDLV